MALISALGEARRLLPRTQGTSAPVGVPGAEPVLPQETWIPLLAGWVQAALAAPGGRGAALCGGGHVGEGATHLQISALAPRAGRGRGGEKSCVFSPFISWEMAFPTFSGFGELLIFTHLNLGPAGRGRQGH